MQFEDFIKKYDGQTADYDGNFGGQCVDLYRFYVKEVLGFPQSPPVEGAKDIWNTYLPEYFKRIENTPTGVPEKGDIVIFGTNLGKYGHVSIFTEGNTTKFTSFDQNYPSGSKCHLQGHTYSAVLGWLTPLKKPMDIPSWFKTLLQESELTLENEGAFRAFWEKAIKYDVDVRSLQEQVKSANEALADRALEVSMLTEKNQKLSDAATEAQEQLNQARSERNQAIGEKQALQVQVESLSKKVEENQKDMNVLQAQYEALRIDYATLEKKKIEGISFWQFIKVKLGR